MNILKIIQAIFYGIKLRLMGSLDDAMCRSQIEYYLDEISRILRNDVTFVDEEDQIFYKLQRKIQCIRGIIMQREEERLETVIDRIKRERFSVIIAHVVRTTRELDTNAILVVTGAKDMTDQDLESIEDGIMDALPETMDRTPVVILPHGTSLKTINQSELVRMGLVRVSDARLSVVNVTTV